MTASIPWRLLVHHDEVAHHVVPNGVLSPDPYLFTHATIPDFPTDEIQHEAGMAWARANGIDPKNARAKSVAILCANPERLDETAVIAWVDFVRGSDGNVQVAGNECVTIERRGPLLVPLPDPPTFPVNRYIPSTTCQTSDCECACHATIREEASE